MGSEMCIRDSRYSEAQGEHRRAVWRQAPEQAASAAAAEDLVSEDKPLTDEVNIDMDAAPTSTDTGSNWAKEALDTLFGKRR